MIYYCLSFNRNLTLGASALICYLHACRHQSEPNSRKYLARTIRMLTYDDENVIYTLSSCYSNCYSFNNYYLAIFNKTLVINFVIYFNNRVY